MFICSKWKNLEKIADPEVVGRRLLVFFVCFIVCLFVCMFICSKWKDVEKNCWFEICWSWSCWSSIGKFRGSEEGICKTVNLEDKREETLSWNFLTWQHQTAAPVIYMIHTQKIYAKQIINYNDKLQYTKLTSSMAQSYKHKHKYWTTDTTPAITNCANTTQICYKW